MKKIYVLAAIDAYNLTYLEYYINRNNDIIMNSEGAVLGGFLFIPKRIVTEYIKKNRQN